MYTPAEAQTLFQRASEKMTTVGGIVADGAERAGELYGHIMRFSGAVDSGVMYGLFPLCLVLTWLHEYHRSVSTGGAFQLGAVALRAGLTMGAFLAYGKLCALITGIAGGGGGWMTGGQLEQIVGQMRDPLHTNHADVGWDVAALGKLLMLLFIWVIVVCSALLAYCVSAFLALVQAAFITIIIAVGPICIVVSMVPGVGVAKSWARALAQTAAWSTLAGIITALLLAKVPNVNFFVIQGDIPGLLKCAAQLLVLAACTACVPMLAAKIMSGAAPATAGVVGALAGGFAAVRVATSSAGNVVRGGADGLRGGGGRAAGRGEGDGGDDGSGMVRPHKAPFLQRASAAVVGGVIAPATALLGGAKRAGSAPAPRRERRVARGGEPRARGQESPGEAPPRVEGAAAPSIDEERSAASAAQRPARVMPVVAVEPAAAAGPHVVRRDELPQERRAHRGAPVRDDRAAATPGRGDASRGAEPEGASAPGPAAAASGSPGARVAPAPLEKLIVSSDAVGPAAARIAAPRIAEPPVAADHPTGQQAVGHGDVTGQYGDKATPLALSVKKLPPVSPNVIRRTPRPAVEDAEPAARVREEDGHDA